MSKVRNDEKFKVILEKSFRHCCSVMIGDNNKITLILKAKLEKLVDSFIDESEKQALSLTNNHFREYITENELIDKYSNMYFRNITYESDDGTEKYRRRFRNYMDAMLSSIGAKIREILYEGALVYDIYHYSPKYSELCNHLKWKQKTEGFVEELFTRNDSNRTYCHICIYCLMLNQNHGWKMPKMGWTIEQLQELAIDIYEQGYEDYLNGVVFEGEFVVEDGYTQPKKTTIVEHYLRGYEMAKKHHKVYPKIIIRYNFVRHFPMSNEMMKEIYMSKVHFDFKPDSEGFQKAMASFTEKSKNHA